MYDKALTFKDHTIERNDMWKASDNLKWYINFQVMALSI